MSPKTCLFVTALLTPVLPACVGPDPQGSTESTGETTDTSSTGDTSNTGEPVTTTMSVMTSDPMPTSTTQAAEGCSDGVKNGSETDIDCGGGECGPCDGEASCVDDSDCKSGRCPDGACLPLLPSCLELHMALPDLPSGEYPLDPGGDGEVDAQFHCDMDPSSPGWTRVFAPDSAGTWDPLVEGACGDLGDMYGPYGMGDVLSLDITAAGVPHTELRLEAEAIVIDSWDAFDAEELRIALDDVNLFSVVCDYQAPVICNQEANHCGDPSFNDGLLPVSTMSAPHDGDAIALRFTSTLNEPVEAESWGVRGVYVLVK